MTDNFNTLSIYDTYGFKLFLCKPDKSPDTKGDWRDEKNQITIEEAVKYQSEGRMIGAWIPEDVAVLDIDRHEGKPDGLTTLKDIAALYNFDIEELNKTLVVKTCNNGFHFIFTTKTNFRQNSKGPGIDLKTNKGYIIAAGSPGYQALNENEPKPLPLELELWLQACENGNKDQKETEDNLPLEEIRELRSALNYIDPDDRSTWILAGMALKSTGSRAAEGLFNEYSQRSEKYNPSDQSKRWKGLKPNGDVTIASIFHLAKLNGWNSTYQKGNSKSPTDSEAEDKIPAWITNNYGLDYTKELLAELEKSPPPKSGGRCYFLNMDFPETGGVLVATRTGKGKTTTLANIERGLLQQGKSVVKLSIEEPFPLAFSRLAQSFGYELANKEGVSASDFPVNSWLGRFNAFNAEDPWVRKGAEIVKKYIKDGQLRLLDSTVKDGPRELNSFYHALKQNKNVHIITLDYVQLLNIGMRRNFEVWGDVAGKIIENMAIGQSLLVAAAQLNRLGTETSMLGKNYDPSAEQLRESASLEQLASYIIGGGEEDEVLFYKLMKDRFSQIGAGKYLINNTPKKWMEKNYMFPTTFEWSYNKTPTEKFVNNMHENDTNKNKPTKKNTFKKKNQPWQVKK